jgi:hypothetical protein
LGFDFRLRPLRWTGRFGSIIPTGWDSLAKASPKPGNPHPKRLEQINQTCSRKRTQRIQKIRRHFAISAFFCGYEIILTALQFFVQMLW